MFSPSRVTSFYLSMAMSSDNTSPSLLDAIPEERAFSDESQRKIRALITALRGGPLPCPVCASADWQHWSITQANHWAHTATSDWEPPAYPIWSAIHLTCRRCGAVQLLDEKVVREQWEAGEN